MDARRRVRAPTGTYSSVISRELASSTTTQGWPPMAISAVGPGPGQDHRGAAGGQGPVVSAIASADEDGASVAYALAAQHDHAGPDAQWGRHAVLAGAQQQRAAYAVGIGRQGREAVRRRPGYSRCCRRPQARCSRAPAPPASRHHHHRSRRTRHPRCCCPGPVAT